MTGSSISPDAAPPVWSARRAWATSALFGLILLLAALARARPFLSQGIWGTAIDYDEGVYSASAQLLARGVLPYRDFVFVHPPGWLYLLALLSRVPGLVDPARSFEVSCLLALVFGVINTALVGSVAWRWRGPLAGVLAAFLYAVYAEAMRVERGPFLEPALNCACLLGLLLMVRARSVRTAWAAGLVLGCAVAIKLTGAIFLLGGLVALWTTPGRKLALHAAAASAVAWFLLVTPLAALAPAEFIQQTLLFQVWRPPDGLANLASRLNQTLFVRHETTGAFALIGAFAALRAWRREPEARAWLTVFLATVAAFLANTAYWFQYNAFIAGTHSVLVAVAVRGGASWVWRSHWRAKGWWVAALLSVVAIPPLERAFRDPLSPGQGFALAPIVRSRVSEGSCFLPFEPAWGLVAGALPSGGPALGPMADPYAAMLLGAVNGGLRFADATEAFRSAGARASIRPYLDRCDVVALGRRGHWQLGDDGVARVAARLVRLGPSDESEVDVWGLPEGQPPAHPDSGLELGRTPLINGLTGEQR